MRIVDKTKISYQGIIISNFNYCLPVNLDVLWEKCKRHNQPFDLHNRALRVLYRDYDALRVLHRDYDGSLEDLLKRSGELTIHCKNLQGPRPRSHCSIFVMMHFCCIKATCSRYFVLVQKRGVKNPFLCVHIAPFL